MPPGVSNFSALGYYYQVQAEARPANDSDLMLVRWLKPPSNPISVQLPPGGTHAQFRDPTTVWRMVRTSNRLTTSQGMT